MTGKMAEPLFEEKNWLVYAVVVGGVRHRRPAALADLVGAARPHPAEHRDRVAGAAMKHDGGILLTLAGYFALMSLFAIGGANGAHSRNASAGGRDPGWMTDRQFADMFALAQVTPGPNVIIVTPDRISCRGHRRGAGHHARPCAARPAPLPFSWAGYGIVSRMRAWRIAIQAGLVPVSIGLIAASALIVARAASTSWVSVALTLVTAAVTYRLTLNPLWIFAVAAVLGLAGAI